MVSSSAEDRDYAEGGERTGKVAFVLSGGGNKGAIEVGALQVLLEHGIRPDILVGTSVGAINAAALAVNPTLEGARWLEEIWRGVTRKDVLPNNYLATVWRVVTGEKSLFTNQNLRDFLESKLPKGIRKFSDVKGVELYITAVDLDTGELYTFGIDRSEDILDAIMASAALPIFLAPWEYRGREYVDGGVVRNLPLRVALNAGATEIWAIDMAQSRTYRRASRGILTVIGKIVAAVRRQQSLDELALAGDLPEDRIHHIAIHAFEGLRAWDFGHTAEMIEVGRVATLGHLRGCGLARAEAGGPYSPKK